MRHLDIKIGVANVNLRSLRVLSLPHQHAFCDENKPIVSLIMISINVYKRNKCAKPNNCIRMGYVHQK